MIEKLESLKALAAEQGFGTVGYFLDAALSEARYQLDRHNEDREISEKPVSELWMPEQDKD